MASVLNKTTKEYIPSVNTPDYMDGSWIINPDDDIITLYPSKYWVIEGDVLRVATALEQTNIDLFVGFEDKTNSQIVDIIHNRINIFRDEYIDEGIIFNGYLFDIDQRARQNIIGMCSAVSLGIQIPVGFTWRSKWNEDIPMDAQSLTMFGMTALTFVSTCFSASWAHKDYLTSLIPTAPSAQLISYDYTLNWPSRSLDGSLLRSQEPPQM